MPRSLASTHAVVVLGGGIAGCATALALCRRGIDDILIVEAGSYDTFQIGECIPPETRLLLEDMQIWQDFLKEGHETCLGNRSAWGSDVIGYNDFLLNPHGTGWHLDRRKFGAFMARRAMQQGAELRSNTRFVSAECVGEGGLELELKTEQGARRVHAQFVVDATGPRFCLAKAMGAKSILHDRLIWIGVVFESPSSPEVSQFTMLEAAETGWWYAARLPGERIIVAAVTDGETNELAMLHRPERWLSGLKKTVHMAAWLHGCARSDSHTTAIRVAPSFLLDRVHGGNWLAVGDAASAYDPITSQGIYKALHDGVQSAVAIADHLAGAVGAFDDYQAAVVSRFADYLANRNDLYDLEQRWLSSPFWRNRKRPSPHPKPSLGAMRSA